MWILGVVVGLAVFGGLVVVCVRYIEGAPMLMASKPAKMNFVLYSMGRPFFQVNPVCALCAQKNELFLELAELKAGLPVKKCVFCDADLSYAIQQTPEYRAWEGLDTEALRERAAAYNEAVKHLK